MSVYSVVCQFVRTFPQEDFAAGAAACLSLASSSNSSAKPQEQFLQALRFPVVPQTKNHIQVI